MAAGASLFFVGEKPGAKLHPAFLYFMKEERRWM